MPATKHHTSLPRYLGVPEAAHLAACHPDTLRDALRRGELPATKTSTAKSGRWKIHPDALQEWIERNPR